ncbi:MAG TPA: O-antigen ligase family protein [Solimonas sp.]|nr:O-antigen ligase family protein [Solimonas sp.]
MNQPALPESGPDRFVFAGLVVLLLWLPLPWGSTSGWARDLFCTLAWLLLAAWLLQAVLGRAGLPPRPRRHAWALLIWLLWIGWIAGQMLALPSGLLAELSPEAVRVHAALAQVPGASARLTTSIAAGATADALLLTLGYFALYWLIVLSSAGTPGRVRLLLATLVVGGLAQALFGSLMTLSGVEYGLFGRKWFYLGSATGSFVNRNHFAGYLELTGAAALALVLAGLGKPLSGRSWRQLMRDTINLFFSDKIRARVALAVMVVGIVMSRSRMGNIAFFASLCVCGLGYIVLRERALAFRAAVLFLSLLVVDTLIVSRWLGIGQVIERLERTDVAEEGRVQLLEEIPPVIDSFLWAGSGLGTFASAYAPHRSPRMHAWFDHAHNDYVELLVETGVPGLALLLTLAGIHYLHAARLIVLRRRRFPAAVGFATFMAMSAYGLHSLVDFNLQIPANAATLVALMAMSACCSARAGAGEGVRRREAPDRDSSGDEVRPG